MLQSRVQVVLLVPLLTGCPTENTPGIRNADPRAEITSHDDGDQPDAGYRTFTGTVEDPDHEVDELELVWLYDGAEACPPVAPDDSGNTSCEIFLDSGDRTVTLQVEDPIGGIGSDKVNLDVQPYGDPWAEISSPVQGDIYYSDQLIEFSGTVGDDADQPGDLVVEWESSLEGVLDLGAEPDASGGLSDFGYLIEGEHAITLTVTNTGGNQDNASVIIDVGPPNTAPSCEITAPEDGAEGDHGLAVSFEALVDDADIPADWLVVTWSSDLDGELGQSTPNTDGSVSFTTAELSAGTHEITMRVEDELAESCTTSVTYTVLDCSDTWFEDADEDGYGAAGSSTTGCEQPTGYVTDDSDCDDGDAAIHPAATEVCDGVDNDCDGDVDADDGGVVDASTWYLDYDGDGFGSTTLTTIACDQPSSYVADASDCDDTNATTYPGADEYCDGHDDDCDGVVDEDTAVDASDWYADADADGYGDAGSSSVACTAPSGSVADGTDCDDSDASINPGAAETCNGVDDDCDGDVDEDSATDASTWYADADADGYGDAGASTVACSVPTGYTSDATDCDDADAAANPGADEYCDGHDDDCDGVVDEDDALDASTWYTDGDTDGYGDPTSSSVACSAPSGSVADATDCDDADAAVHPAAPEYCDGVDNNCDGTVDEDAALDAATFYADADGDAYGDASSTLIACAEPTGYVSDDADCDDTDASVNPGADEYCDGHDDDCDGDVDEDDAIDAATWYADSDGDSYGDPGAVTVTCSAGSGHVSDATDCDDTDATINPGADEYCDGHDNDCDGSVDEDDALDASSWYADSDGDGYGDSGTSATACSAPSGYIADATDCDDGDSLIHPAAPELCNGADDDCDGSTDEDDALDAVLWYADADGDGYGEVGSTTTACSAPTGYCDDASDCDDTDAAVNPGADEACNGTDDDCDGDVDEDDSIDALTWYADTDSDGFGDAGSTTTACSLPAGYSADATDCDDGDGAAYPGADEYCDGHDDDCDGDVDEDDALDASTWYLDYDSDGYGDAGVAAVACSAPSGYVADATDCDDGDASYNPGIIETDCTDPNDYNCDGSTGYADDDSDGWAACEECDDTDADVYPGADELCNGVDDDCDGDIDEAEALDAIGWYADDDGDGYGDASTSEIACDAPSGYIVDATDCDDTDADTHPGASEYCDGHDDDCDGSVDESDAVDVSTWYADSDGDSYGDALSTETACDAPTGYVADNTDCDDTSASTHPVADEYCNSVDDDCDGDVDEDDAVDAGTWYIDYDSDGYGASTLTDVACTQPSHYVLDSTDCDDTSSSTNPGADEYCDGHDDDCDGDIDEDDATDASTWYADADSDGYGDATSTEIACAVPSGYTSDDTDCDDDDDAVYPGADESCNGLDDDCDGVVDEDSADDATTWYADTDADGYGDALDADTACEAPTGYVADDSDCDDSDASTHPGASEYCDGHDDDCDGDVDEDDAVDASTWFIDYDSDGYGTTTLTDIACTQPSLYVADSTDCDDSSASTHPGADEYCDGHDDDCDGDVDEDDALDATTWYIDYDSDGYGAISFTQVACDQPSRYVADVTDCDDTDADTYPGADEYCDGHDDDCDGSVDEDDALDTSTWYADVDGDSYGDPLSTDYACAQPSGYLADSTDCDDGDASINPGAAETCNGSDDDCDGTTDEDDATDALSWYADADSDGYGDASSSDVACSAPAGHVADATDCDDADAFSHPGAPELCDGADDDCDGTTDEDDALDAGTWYADSDADGYGDPADSMAACAAPSGYIADATDCDDDDTAAYPGADEYCDGTDNDCDGTTDEDDALDASTWYADGDGDGYGDAATTDVACTAPSGFVADATDCDDGDAAYNPGAAEDDCTDPADYNCDGSTGYADDDADGYAACIECDDTDPDAYPGADEYCDGHDDDCDGVVDEDDALDASTWYADGDSDGYGDAATTTAACSEPSGYVADATDCDDTAASTNPGADEYCDGHDDDCDGSVDEDDAVDASTWYADTDSDGYGDSSATDIACSAPSGYVADATDCDDGESTTNPGADEYCDGHDDDCDGTTDEDDAVDASTWYADADGDLYGDALTTDIACSALSGYVADATDCDDSEATTYPGAYEYCDGHDDDCDGTTDEDDAVDASTWYADGDGDLYGDASSSAAACVQPTGYVADAMDCDDMSGTAYPGAAFDESPTDCMEDGDGDGYGDEAATGSVAAGTDCDDGESLVNPGEIEVCDDGLDNDCDGTSDGCTWSGTTSLSSPDAKYQGDSAHDHAGYSIAGVGDVDLDGYDDFLVGATSYGGSLEGSVYLVLGPGSGTSTLGAAAAVQFVGSSGSVGSDWLGFDVAGAGDTNGDGWPDLIMSRVQDGTSTKGDGSVYVFTGPATSHSGLGSYDAQLIGETSDDDAGTSIAGGGDVDGDGFDDIVMGAPYYTDSSYTSSYWHGATYLFHGPVSGDVSCTAADAKIVGANIGYAPESGTSVSIIDDGNGDGFSELAIGAPIGVDGSGIQGGFACVFNGPVAGELVISVADSQWTGESSGDQAGNTVSSAGDLNADGYDDLLVGAPGASSWAGAVYLCLGPHTTTSSLASADAKIIGYAADDMLGKAQATAADFDQDGYSDIAVSTSRNDLGGSSAGAAFVLYGPQSGTMHISAADAIFTGSGSVGLGYSIASGGDIDGSGYPDLLIGTISEDTEAGAVYLVLASGL